LTVPTASSGLQRGTGGFVGRRQSPTARWRGSTVRPRAPPLATGRWCGAADQGAVAQTATAPLLSAPGML